MNEDGPDCNGDRVQKSPPKWPSGPVSLYIDAIIAVFYHHVMRRLLLIIPACLALQILVCGCVNTPGALQLKVSVEQKEISPNDSIRLSACLIAEEGPISLAKTYHFAAEVSRLNSNAKPMDTDEFVARCGTGILECLLLSPILFPCMLGDIGDTMGRYIVLNEDEQKEHNLEIFINQRKGKNYCSFYRSSTTNHPAHTWPPGEYRIKVRLQNEFDGGTAILPAPLFWQPYNQPVEAEVTIKVVQ